MYKRLQTICSLLESRNKTAAIEEAEAILFFQPSPEIEKLIELIKKADYLHAIEFCHSIKNKQSTPDHIDNIDIIGLQTTYQMLQTQFLVLTTQKAEADKLITQFRIRYYQELGFIISDILKERMKLFQTMRDSNPDAHYEHEKTQEQYEQFSKNWENVPKQKEGNLNEELRQRLQFAFRKASKLCHPDAVEEQEKKKAAEIFVQLNKAYFNNDVETVEAILQQLENGILKAETKAINDKKALQAKINKLKHDVGILKNDYLQLTQSQTYQFISKLADWDEYFSETKTKLEKELEELKNYEQNSGTSTNAK
ncbi:MAG: hypothetical protein GYA62_14245 [Bacteroidales bacterium]|nr:hypothetical protein [Bacteroidales bacterium]